MPASGFSNRASRYVDLAITVNEGDSLRLADNDTFTGALTIAVAALAAGDCGVGIVSSASGRPVVPGFRRQPLSVIRPLPRTGNVDAIGISRHASQPEAAGRLLEAAELREQNGEPELAAALFERADEAYAPANAAEPVQAAATSVIGHHDEDGIARFLRDRFELD